MIMKNKETLEKLRTYQIGVIRSVIASRNLITRALGPDAQVQADSFSVPWRQGDFILLCTDGLVNTVSDQEMLFEVLHDGDIESCLDHLLQISLRRGAPDNITAVLLMNE